MTFENDKHTHKIKSNKKSLTRRNKSWNYSDIRGYPIRTTCKVCANHGNVAVLLGDQIRPRKLDALFFLPSFHMGVYWLPLSICYIFSFHKWLLFHLNRLLACCNISLEWWKRATLLSSYAYNLHPLCM